jgi:uncharacterized protein (TIGR02996 family)
MADAMTHDEAFLLAIRDEPDDDAPRLIYADWLEDHGEEARAEFIRAQCERVRPDADPARAAELGPRAWRLLVENWEAWVGPLRGLVGPDGARLGEQWLMGGPHADGLSRFRRGFVESLTLRAEVLLAWGDDVYRQLPLRHLRLWGAGPHAEALAASPCLGGLATLAFCDYFVGPLTAEGARALAASPHLGRLRELRLGRNNVGDVGLRALAAAPRLDGLLLLNVMDNGITDRGALALAASPYLARLTTLWLQDNAITAAGAAALRASPHLRRLTDLNLRGNPCTQAL